MAINQMLGEVLERAGIALGRRHDGEEFPGKIPSAEFFQAAYAEDPRAFASLSKKYYRTSWRLPFFRSSVEKEMFRADKRSGLARLTPRGALTGYKHYGIGRALSNFHPGALKMAGVIGMASMAFEAATAKKGHIGAALTKSVGENVGGIMGAAAGAFMLGLPGELVGGFVGSEIGGTIGRAVTTIEDIGRQRYHANLGGHYEDSEPAWTLRQRAVQEMGSSALNARMWLGKEAALMHS